MPKARDEEPDASERPAVPTRASEFTGWSSERYVRLALPRALAGENAGHGSRTPGTHHRRGNAFAACARATHSRARP